MALVEIERLTYTYGGSSAGPSLHSCSLSADAGELVLLLGPSGCGKSTLLRAVNGLVPHFHGGSISGSVRVGGLDTREHGPAELAHLVACVFQDPEAQIVASTVLAEVALGIENLGVAPETILFRAHEALGAMGIAHLAERSTRSLSGGEMQRVAIASALAMRPAVLVLDEPTSQLDPTAAESLLELLRRINEDSGIAVILAEHRLDRCYHWADRVVVMGEGRILSDGSPEESAAWSAEHGNLFVPPVARLFAGLKLGSLPLNVKQGRALFRQVRGERAETVTAAGLASAPSSAATARATTAASAAVPATAPPRATTPAGDAATPGITVKGLRFSYSNGFEALRGCDLEIERGHCVALMGQNGAGKSTLVRHFNGLNRPMAGSVLLMGRDVSRVPVEELARTCGFLGQNPNDFLFCDTVKEELEFSLDNLRPELDLDARQKSIDATLTSLGIEQLKDREPRALSVGQRQRVAVAAMSVAKPAVLVLDEPTRGLDWESKVALGSHLHDLRQRGTTVVVVTHDVEFTAEYCDRVVVMGSGLVLADGEAAEVLGSSLFLAPQVTRVLGDESGSGVVTLEAGRALLKELFADG